MFRLHLLQSSPSKVVGAGKTVSLTGTTIAGADASNYVLSFTGAPTATANITAKVLTIGGTFTVNNKTYDGTTAAVITANSLTLMTLAGSDVVSLTAVAVFSDINSGAGKTVSLTGSSLAGLDAPNYTLSLTGAPVTTATIFSAGLTVTGITANNKVYNGTTTAVLNYGSAILVGVLGTDIVNLNFTGIAGNFVDKNIGTGKLVSISGLTLSGADAGKYNLIQPISTASITSAGLTVSGLTANNKVYDGTASATLNTGSAVPNGVFAGDVVTINSSGATGTFGDNNVGTGKPVTTSGFTLGGTDAANYTLTQPVIAANITAAPLTVSGITANDKVYNGTVTAALNYGSATLVGIIGTDVVNLISTGITGAFVNKNIGTGKIVNITGLTLSGTDAGKYSLVQPATTASITSSGLTISGLTANNKAYDGTTSATLNTGSAVLAGVFTGDVVTINSSGATGTFSDINVGTGKPVTTSGFALGGADAGNYTLTQPVITANITGADLTVSGITAISKVYDGNTTANLNSGSATLVGVVGTDVVDLILTGITGTFADKNIGSNKIVNVTGITVSGPDAGKYNLIQPASTANITSAGLTISGLTAVDKVYDGTKSATLNVGSVVLAGVFGADIVTINSSAATGTFADKNTGTGKPVSTSGFTLGGADAGNYTLTQPATAANIATNTLTVSGITANNKTYDGTTSATLNAGSASLVGVFGADVVNLVSSGASGTFADKNVGTAKAVLSSGFTLDGTDAANYILTQPSVTADIGPKALTVTANDLSKSYGTALAFAGTEYSTSGLLTGDVVTGITISSPGAALTASIGTYAILITGGVNNNYLFSYVGGTLTVGKSTITATADNKTKVYGSANPVLTITYSGFKNNEDGSVLDVPPVVSTVALTASNAGTYAITISGGSDNNYDITLVNGSLQITKAPLSVKAEDKNKIYGQTNPALTFTYTGFVLGQNQSNLDVPPVVGTSATVNSDAGNYDINVFGRL